MPRDAEQQLAVCAGATSGARAHVWAPTTETNIVKCRNCPTRARMTIEIIEHGVPVEGTYHAEGMWCEHGAACLGPDCSAAHTHRPPAWKKCDPGCKAIHPADFDCPAARRIRGERLPVCARCKGRGHIGDEPARGDNRIDCPDCTVRQERFDAPS